MLNIFNPSRVFRNTFASSWCQNIVTIDTDAHIPIIKTDNPPTLSLEALPEVEYFIGVLPIIRSWQPINLSLYKTLKFRVMAANTDMPSLSISLASIRNNQEYESTLIDLLYYGLMEDCEQEFIIPLNEFTNTVNFDLTTVRMLKFIGYGSFNVKLSMIYIE